MDARARTSSLLFFVVTTAAPEVNTCPTAAGQPFPANCTPDMQTNMGICTPRRCCGDPSLPVLGGVDLVQLYDCVQRENGGALPQGSSPACVPQKGDAAFSSKLGGYAFHFVSPANARRFANEPRRFAPKAGGFCASSFDSADTSGPGFWCACPYHENGYSYINGAAYFFLFLGAKQEFLGLGEKALRNLELTWPPLLADNNAREYACFNTQRLVPGVGFGDDPWDPVCKPMSCNKYKDCPDCAAGLGQSWSSGETVSAWSSRGRGPVAALAFVVVAWLLLAARLGRGRLPSARSPIGSAVPLSRDPSTAYQHVQQVETALTGCVADPAERFQPC